MQLHQAIRISVFVILTSASVATFAAPIQDRSEVIAFVDRMVKEYDFDRQSLIALFGTIEVQRTILKAIQSPYEAKPWYRYRKTFLNTSRIEKGLVFWNEHENALKETQRKYGVPPEIIVAIIGVETQYGTYMGSHRVLDSLFTLGFDYPRRSRFFLGELKHFLLLCREENLDPSAPVGSYAGAMGIPQFMPSSFRRYAVDINRDKQRDIWNNTPEAIASVGNYFSEHGWLSGQPVTYPVEVDGETYHSVLGKGLKPNHTIKRLRKAGVRISEPVGPETKGRLLEFEETKGTSFWLALQNFYVITRYNRSAHYAMAVYQLAQEILAKHNLSKAKS